ncbi:MAG TPA: adenylate/guanylate cyclase domain-containing protein [Gemmatimonadaceae bacterium]|nr:adenylate/guanylate cyclase domain-containing protein [Gemmatimonadaceae bacterium]
MRLKLVGTDGAQSFELREGPPLIVGRAPNSDIPILDPTISRRHAEVECGDEGFAIRDLGSSNGTYVNGERVTHRAIAPGDVLTFGKVSFRVAEAPDLPPLSPRASGAHPTPDTGARASGTIRRQLSASGSHGLLSSRLRGSDITAAPEDDASQDERRLALLVEIAKGLSGAVDINSLLDKIATYVFQIFDADRVAINLLGDTGEMVPKISRDRRGTEAGRTVPQSIARKVIQEKVAVLTYNAPEDERFGGQSILQQSVRSAMCAPLLGTDHEVQGVLYVDNQAATHQFGDEDLNFLVAFSGIGGVAIENSKFGERIRKEALVRSNFERYFAPSLAARIASSPDAVRLGGDKRAIAVLFSDIRGFTALSETMNPDDMAALLSEYFTEMVDCVFRHGGTLDKFMGDAVMAQWGAPIAAEDDADRAMTAALDMMRSVDELNKKWRTAGKPTLQIGIGLNYGEAFAGNIGSERRLEFTVIGDAVNTAARLCSAADGGEILLTDEMKRVLRHPPKLKERAPMELKGKAQPVPVYSIMRK